MFKGTRKGTVHCDIHKAGHALKIGSEMIPVSGYKIQRAADGTTEFL